MAISAIEEFCVYYDTFRSVDLYQQGIYYLQTSILQKNTGIPAYPYDFTIFNPLRKGKRHSLFEPRISANNMHSKCFIIKYFDEMIEMREKVFFRCEVPFSAGSSFSLKVDLFFSETSEDEDLQSLSKESLRFEQISTVAYDLDFTLSMESGFLPIIFPSHYSIVNSTVHYLLLNFKFPPTKDSILQVFTNKGKPKKYIGGSEADRIFKQFALPLVDSYTKLHKYLLLLLHRCLTADDRFRLGLAEAPPSLTLPGDSPLKKHRRQASLEELTPPTIDFSTRISSHDPLSISTSLLYELNLLSSQLESLWATFCKSTAQFPRQIRFLLQERYRDALRAKYSTGHIVKTYELESLHLVNSEPLEVPVHSIRLQNAVLPQANTPIKDPSFRLKVSEQPIVLEETTLLRPTTVASKARSFHSKSLRPAHFFVLVHGFQGCSSDMKTLKNAIIAANPQSYFLLSSVNEEDTEASILIQGHKLALEVNSLIKSTFLRPDPSKISFIGHSLGGLVIRAALPHLSHYSGKMHLFMTTSTPHLGLSNNSSALVTAGIWLLRQLKHTPSLIELTLSDNSPEECVLSTLSRAGGCEWFKHFVLLSSPQDKYVSEHSARVETAEGPLSLSSRMAKSILARRTSVSRLSVDFQIPQKFFESLIGRAAHVQFLEDEVLMRTLIHTHPEYFC